ncbi:hypothetical protein V1509DRAFT_652018 [Lipomyces kononenkoae]
MDVNMEPASAMRDPSSSPTARLPDPHGHPGIADSAPVDAMFDEIAAQTDDSTLDDFGTLSPASSANADTDTAATPGGALSSGSLSDSNNNTSISNIATTTTPPSQPSLSRKGSSRKSTLTQQQKNNKRQRATTEQLAILETEFSINPAPNGKTRLRIADKINMTERSVQIWFQNRRAKIKLLAKKSIETGGDTDLIPESMKHYLAVQSTGPGSSSSSAYFARAFGLTGPKSAMARSASFSGMANHSFVLPGSEGMMVSPAEASQNAAAKTLVNRFTCRSLSIGTWRRVGCTAMDLVIFYSPSQSRFTYYINNDSVGFKIEYPFSYVNQIYVEGHAQKHQDAKSGTRETEDERILADENTSPEMGDIVIILARPPHFFMESASVNGGWFGTDDFTEDQQASKVMEHRLTGPLKILEQQLSDLLCLKTDTTKSRPVRSNSSGSTNSNTPASGPKLINSSSFATSAPVSPLVADPSTSGQPSLSALASRVYPDESPAFPPRGGQPSHLTHRRTRSRSVPVAIDFSYLGPALTPGYSFHSGAPPVVSQAAPDTGVPSQVPMPLPMSVAVSTPAAASASPAAMMGLSPAVSTPNANESLRLDTTGAQAQQYFDMYSYPMSAASEGSATGFHGADVLGTPIMQSAMGTVSGLPPTPLPPTPGVTGLTGDMVNLNPFAMTNTWVDRTNEVYPTTQGYGMNVPAVLGADVSAAGGGSEDIVLPDNGGAEMFQPNFVKPEFMDTTMEGVAMAAPQMQTEEELAEFGMLGIGGSTSGHPHP